MPWSTHLSSKWLSQQEIAAKFAALLDRMGWGPSEAARALGKDQGDVSRWRAGKRPIPREVLEAAATAAGETEVYFTRDGATADEERRDRAIVATWLEAEAARLRLELKSPAGAAPPAPGPGDRSRAVKEAQKGKGRKRA